MPSSLSNKPEVSFWMPEYIQAFELLSSRRSTGMAINPISLQDIGTHIDLFQPDDFQEFISLICAMDEKFISVMNKKQATKDKPK